MQRIKFWLDRVSKKYALRPRSNGIPVRRNTAAHIRAADSARALQNWNKAALYYREALALEPHLYHLWIQLGHMEKEAGAIERATAAYEEAARLKIKNVEPLLHLGHMAKAWWQPNDAAAYFIKALLRDPGNLQALSELARLMPDRGADASPGFWEDAFTVFDLDPTAAEKSNTSLVAEHAILFDVTDLFAFFGQRRLPTGIQRVQIEISLAFLDEPTDIQPVFCLYSGARRGWIALPHDQFRALCHLAKQSDDVIDPVWVRQLENFYRKVAVSPTIQLSTLAVLINLGTSWADRNYLLDVRNARDRKAMIYIPLVFDLIPLIGPDWFMQSLVRDYRTWFGSMLHSVDGCLAISQATRQDLIEQSAMWDAPIAADAVSVVSLNGDFKQSSAGVDVLQQYGLKPGNYVLMVSTLEPRKNHIGAFSAWLKLVERLGEAAVPHLVCVGGRGWLNDGLHQMLRDNPQLNQMVKILHGVPDDRLATLYEHCLFSLYPSFYEGWGLPVSEALSYGKVPAVSAVSSLPEAGGAYASYFNPHDADDIAATVLTLLDRKVLATTEAAIEHSYAPQTWLQIAQNLVAKAQLIKPRRQDDLMGIAGPGTWLMSLPREINDIMLSGEAMRHGDGWLVPTNSGCRINGKGAALWFSWSGSPDGQAEIHVASMPSPAHIKVELNGLSQETLWAPDTPIAISLPLPDSAGPVHINLIPITGELMVEKIVVTQKPISR